ncbi:hypothetical protein [Burkholderia cepacia]|uniref:hypothetical protein n=1 Tax=Burkholderia cepacia TaxID=292 RepID=UPI000F5B392B|nr:hypothetical protein [Burkholderia cepacia]
MTTIEFVKITSGIIFATIGFLVAVAKVAEDAVHPNIGQRFATEFGRFAATPSLSRAYVLASLSSDAVFGSRLLSLRSLVTSVGISIGWIMVFLLVSLLMFGRSLWVFNEVFTPFVVTRFWGFAVLGVFVDFLSTLVMRWLLLTSLSAGPVKRCFVVGASVLLVVANFYVVFGVAKWIVTGYGFAGVFDSIENWIFNYSGLDLLSKLIHDATLVPDGPGQYKIMNGETEVVYAFPEGLFFLSSLLTTVWIWLHLGSALLLKIAIKVDAMKNWLISLSNIGEKPFISVAIIFSVMIGLLWILSILSLMAYRII